MAINKDGPTAGDSHVNAPLGGGNKPKRKKNNLKNLSIKEVSLVPKGANQHSKAVLYKSAPGENGDTIASKSRREGEDPMPKTLEELEKALNEQDAKIEATNKSSEAKDAEIADLKKQLEEANKAKPKIDPKTGKPIIADNDADDPMSKLDELVSKKLETAVAEAVTKATEAVVKSNEALTKQLTETLAKTELLQLEKQAESDYPNIPGTATEKAELLQTIKAMPEAQQKIMFDGLKKQNEMFGGTFTEIGQVGKSSVSKGSNEAQLEVLAKKYQEANPEMSMAKAYNEVLKTEEGTKLYQGYSAHEHKMK
jgi:hypothetical protein